MNLLLWTLLFAQVTEKPKSVAMVLSVQGKAEVTRTSGDKQALAPTQLLFAGDQISTQDASRAVVIYFADKHRETILSSKTATMSESGGKPAAAVEKQTPEKENRVAVDAIFGKLKRSGRAAVVVLRGDDNKFAPPQVTPISGETVTADHTKFSWPAVPGAKQYVMNILSVKSGRLVFTGQSQLPELELKKDSNPLKAGQKYRWRVQAILPDMDSPNALESTFNVADEGITSSLEPIRQLAASESVEDMLLAAVTFEELGFRQESLALYERLARSVPQETMFHVALAAAYRNAGRMKEAQQALRAAEKLGYREEKGE